MRSELAQQSGAKTKVARLTSTQSRKQSARRIAYGTRRAVNYASHGTRSHCCSTGNVACDTGGDTDRGSKCRSGRSDIANHARRLAEHAADHAGGVREDSTNNAGSIRSDAAHNAREIAYDARDDRFGARDE